MIDLMLYSVIEEVMISAVVAADNDEDDDGALAVADAYCPLKQS
jgi:hypothetical protein